MTTYKTFKSICITRIIWVFLAILFINSCKKDETDPYSEYEYLTSSKLIATVSELQVRNMANQVPEISELVSELEFTNVSVYKLKYRTKNVGGGEIIASGVVIIPGTGNSFPLVSYQHGTLTSYTDAPSRYLTGMETKGLATIMASAGYVVSVPDYIGYGETESYPHPYEHAKTLGSASFDMLMASKEFIEYMGISMSGKLFLTGYSEGGNATMALHKHIEEHSDLVVTMSAPAAGAYNKTAFAKDIVQTNTDLTFLPNFMWVIDSYNWIYDLNRNWIEYVNEPYATTLESITNPFYFEDADISHNPQTLFTTETIDGIVNETDLDFMAALADNDIFDWTPQYPVTLYYGTADDYVFPINSTTAYSAMLENGANVTKVPFEGMNHNTALFPYILHVFDLFESLK